MAEAGTGGKRELMTTLVIVLLLTLVGAGVGFAVGTLLAPGGAADMAAGPATEGTEEADAHGTAAPQQEGHGTAAGEAQTSEEVPEDVTEEEEIPATDLAVIPFPAVLTTLAEPKGKWIRVEGSILARPGGETPAELLAAESGERILAYLRTVRLDQLENPSGVLGLRDDLNETVRTLSGGAVRGVLIHGLVIE